MNKTDYDKSGLSAEQIKTLIESEARYKALISGFPDLLFLFSEDGDILDVHAEDESLLVKKPAELLGKNIRSLLPQDLVELAMHAIGEVRKKGTIYTYEYELSVGHSRYFESRFIACGADKYLNIVRDITIKKLAQQKVIESEVKYKALLEANPDLMFLLSEEGVFLDYYAAENTHLYAPPDVFLNKNIRDVLPEELANLTLNSIKAVKETGQIQTYEYQLTFDEPRYFEARMVACGNNEYLSIVREFTDKKKAEEQLRASEETY
ncbi:MAG: PAS domain S-box protein, partial [Candidatus Cloacimonetes bacterium]|nr:PAS domain S-box protein [Candidatus Cloacimonadota bacterium]